MAIVHPMAYDDDVTKHKTLQLFILNFVPRGNMVPGRQGGANIHDSEHKTFKKIHEVMELEDS